MPTVTKKEISKIAKVVLKFLGDQKIESAQDLDKMLSKTFDFKSPEGQISVIKRPSNFGTEAYKVSYTTSAGIPLEIVMNNEIGYSQVICKGDFILLGYEAFMGDAFGNVAQAKRLDSAAISEIKSELETLAESS